MRRPAARALALPFVMIAALAGCNYYAFFMEGGDGLACSDDENCPKGMLCVDEVCRADGCVAQCEGRDCGDDGCGGSCGVCRQGGLCLEEAGTCTPGFAEVPAGSFVMGSTLAADEQPIVNVSLNTDFAMMQTEAPRSLFKLLMGYDHSGEDVCEDVCPALNISWHQAAAFCNALSEAAGLPACYDCSGEETAVACALQADLRDPYACEGFRLPTEAEWEYAARAGNPNQTYNDNLDLIAWYSGNSEGRVHEVGTARSNAWDLYDVLGNVWEWCHDRYGAYPDASVSDPVGSPSGTQRVYRGGSYSTEADQVRFSKRNKIDPGTRGQIGVRPVRSLP